MALTIASREVDGVTVLDLSGRITLGEGSVQLRDAIRDLISKGSKSILLNLGDVNYIDSSGLGELVSAFTTSKNQGATLKLLKLTENYPQLRSSDQFMRLQDELSGTENRIGVARKRYNDAIQDYNTFILQFPNSIWASMAGFKPNDAYFKASEAARTVPNVKF